MGSQKIVQIIEALLEHVKKQWSRIMDESQAIYSRTIHHGGRVHVTLGCLPRSHRKESTIHGSQHRNLASHAALRQSSSFISRGKSSTPSTSQTHRYSVSLHSKYSPKQSHY